MHVTFALFRWHVTCEDYATFDPMCMCTFYQHPYLISYTPLICLPQHLQAAPIYPRISATCGIGGPAPSLPWAIMTSESSAVAPDYIGARAGDFSPLAVCGFVCVMKMMCIALEGPEVSGDCERRGREKTWNP